MHKIIVIFRVIYYDSLTVGLIAELLSITSCCALKGATTLDINNLKERLKANPFLTLSDVIYQSLFEDIVKLQILPETKLNEKQLADMLGVSRSPVNHALKSLCADGLLKKAGKSLCVVPMKKQECRKLYESRFCLEGYAAYLSASRINKEEIEELEKSIEGFEKIIVNDISAQADHDASFHSIVIKSARNPYISAMYKTTEYQLLRYRNSLSLEVPGELLRSFLQESCRSHKSILNAIKLGFSDTARKEMELHIQTMLDAIGEWK